MHCPVCGQKQISEETRFCSRCGFPLTGVTELISNNGLVRTTGPGITGTPDSPRRRGIKKGAFLFLLAFLAVPIMALLTLALDIPPYLPVMAALLFGVGGLLRAVYGLMFESAQPGSDFAPAAPSIGGIGENRGALPPSQSIPVQAYTSPAAGSWRDTNDLQKQPGSVTDSTTKLLHQDERDQ